MIAGLIVALLLLLSLYHSRRHKRQEDELKHTLIPGSTKRGKFLRRKVSSAPAQQWQPPLETPVQFNPSMEAAVMAGGEGKQLLGEGALKPGNHDDISEDGNSGVSGDATAITYDETTVMHADDSTSPCDIRTNDRVVELGVPMDSNQEPAERPAGDVTPPIDKVINESPASNDLPPDDITVATAPFDEGSK